MSDESPEALWARIDERTKHTNDIALTLVETVKGLDGRIAPLEAWKANVDAGLDRQTEMVSTVSQDVANLIVRLDAREKADAERANRQHELFNRFANAGLAAFSGLLLAALGGLTNQIPQLHTAQGGIATVAVLIVGIALLIVITQLFSNRKRMPDP